MNLEDVKEIWHSYKSQGCACKLIRALCTNINFLMFVILTYTIYTDTCETWTSHLISYFYTLTFVLRVCKLSHLTVFVSSVFVAIRSINSKKVYNSAMCRLRINAYTSWLHISTHKESKSPVGKKTDVSLKKRDQK